MWMLQCLFQISWLLLNFFSEIKFCCALLWTLWQRLWHCSHSHKWSHQMDLQQKRGSNSVLNWIMCFITVIFVLVNNFKMEFFWNCMNTSDKGVFFKKDLILFFTYPVHVLNLHFFDILCRKYTNSNEVQANLWIHSVSWQSMSRKAQV